ncbi:hypothetical protein D7V83_05435 [bacterium 0.1xD8-71]|nr:hypothetical protein D7V83_05435 [bacterium 0.1xD8-71]
MAGIGRAYESIINIGGFGNGRNQKVLYGYDRERYVCSKSTIYPCGGNTQYLLERINATRFNKSLLAYINDNGLVIGVSAGSLIFSNNLKNNLGLIDTKLKQLYFMLKEAL